jgi:ADP-heptose:LPS heptosyltransferase
LGIRLIKELRGIFRVVDASAVFLNGLLPKRPIKLEKRRVLINCSARLGDALHFLPELFALQEKLDITIITSEYNDEALRHFFKTIPFRSKLRQNLLDGLLEKVILDSFRILKSGWWYIDSRLSKKEREYDVFFCLTDDLKTLDYALPRSRYVVGLKRYYSLFFDRMTYLDVFSTIGVKIKRDDTYLERALGKIWRVAEPMSVPEIKRPYLLVNVGCKKGRSISGSAWIKILGGLEEFGEEQGITIAVMDNREGDTIARLEPSLKGKNIRLIKEALSLWQGYKLAKGALLYVGMDIGPGHLLQMPTNSVTIFTVGDYRIWKPFALGWHRIAADNGNVAEEGGVGGFVKAVLYHESSCRPCSEVGCETGLCLAITPEFILGQIERIVLEIKKRHSEK